MTCDRVFDEGLFRLLYDGLFKDFVDRRNSEIPDTFVPSAKGVAVGHDLLLSLVNPLATYGKHKPYRWVGRAREGMFRMFAGDYLLEVRRYGKLWGIERKLLFENIHEVLAFDFGPTPIVHRKQQPAMALAKYCSPKPREEAQWCLSWVPIAA
jgi:hypothetical protein